MANLIEFNKGLDELWTNPTEEAKENLKKLLQSLSSEQKEKAKEEIKKRKLESIFSDALTTAESKNPSTQAPEEPDDSEEDSDEKNTIRKPEEKSSLSTKREIKETREDTYSLEAAEERIHSRLFKFALNRWNVGEVIEAKVKSVLPEEIFSTSKTTIQMVYLDKVITECKPWKLIYNQMMKLWGNVKSLFWWIFKSDGSFDLDWALKIGESLPESDKADPVDTKKKEGIIESAKKAHELDSESKWVIEKILSDAMETYNENLKLLTAYAKSKPWFKELLDNPLILSKVLEEWKYEGNWIKIDIKAKEFVYISPKWLESIQDTFVNELVKKANGTGGQVDEVLKHRKTFDKILWSLGFGSIKDIIVSILEMFGIGWLAGKWVDLLEKMLDGKTDKEVFFWNLKGFLDSPRWKEVVSWKTDFSYKELKNFYKTLKKVKFSWDLPEWVEDKNLWSYLLTWKDSEGKEISSIKDRSDIYYLRQVIQSDIINWKTPINSEDLVKWLNALPKDWLSIKKRKDQDEKSKSDATKEKETADKSINEEKNKLNNLIAEIESFIKMTPILNADSKSKIEKSIQEAKEITEKTNVTLDELKNKNQSLKNDFDALKFSLGRAPQTLPPVKVESEGPDPAKMTRLPEPVKGIEWATAGAIAGWAWESVKSIELSTPENPFKEFPLLTTIGWTEVRFESNKKYIILWEKAYEIEDIISENTSQRNSVNLEKITFENGKLKVVFTFADTKNLEKIKELLGPINPLKNPLLWWERKLLDTNPKKLKMYQEIAEKWTVTFEIDPKEFEKTIIQIKDNQWKSGEYKNSEEKLEVKIWWVPNP